MIDLAHPALAELAGDLVVCDDLVDHRGSLTDYPAAVSPVVRRKLYSSAESPLDGTHWMPREGGSRSLKGDSPLGHWLFRVGHWIFSLFIGFRKEECPLPEHPNESL